MLLLNVVNNTTIFIHDKEICATFVENFTFQAKAITNI